MSPVKLPGQPTGLDLAGRSLWVTIDLCPARSIPTPLCPTDLVTLRAGQLAPAAVVPIPAMGPVLSSSAVRSTTFQATLLARIGTAGIASEGQEGLPASLLQTRDGGRSWTLVDNPCDRLEVIGLVHPAAQHWILCCNLDGGMNQGTNQLWDTTDAGRHWHLAAEATQTGPHLGNIGTGISGDLTLSGDGRILWRRCRGHRR